MTHLMYIVVAFRASRLRSLQPRGGLHLFNPESHPGYLELTIGPDSVRCLMERWRYCVAWIRTEAEDFCVATPVHSHSFALVCALNCRIIRLQRCSPTILTGLFLPSLSSPRSTYNYWSDRLQARSHGRAACISAACWVPYELRRLHHSVPVCR